MHGAFLVDHEGRAGADAAQPDEVVQQHAVILGGLLVQITGESHADVFLLGPLSLRKGAVHTNGDYISIELAVAAKTCRDVTQLASANAGESERHKEHHSVFLAKIGAERHVREAKIILFAGAVAGFEGEIRGFGAYFDSHNLKYWGWSLFGRARYRRGTRGCQTAKNCNDHDKNPV